MKSTLTSAGQTTVPVAVRKKLMLQPGDRLTWVELENNGFQVTASSNDAMRMAGIFHDPKRSPASLADIDNAIAEGARSSTE